jgi:hypothetical protein
VTEREKNRFGKNTGMPLRDIPAFPEKNVTLILSI